MPRRILFMVLALRPVSIGQYLQKCNDIIHIRIGQHAFRPERFFHTHILFILFGQIIKLDYRAIRATGYHFSDLVSRSA